MPVSFSAEYLYQGAVYFNFTPSKPEEIAEDPYEMLREIYALGLLVVAPAGAFYHACQAAYNALQNLCTNNETEKKALCDRAWEHLNVAGIDLLAFGMITCELLIFAVGVLSLVSLYFGEYEMALVGALAIAGPLASQYFQYGSIEDLFPSYLFATQPTTFLRFLSTEKNGDEPSQKETYLANYIYAPFLKNGIVKDEPLSKEIILALNGICHKIHPLFVLLETFDILNKASRFIPEKAQNVQTWLSKKEALEKAWAEAISEVEMQPEECPVHTLPYLFAEKAKAIFAN